MYAVHERKTYMSMVNNDGVHQFSELALYIEWEGNAQSAFKVHHSAFKPLNKHIRFRLLLWYLILLRGLHLKPTDTCNPYSLLTHSHIHRFFGIQSQSHC